ncbi:hypothetical protein PG984_014528 [Apiospora sp. TS-2023a]
MAAYSSCKALDDTIEGFDNGPEALQHLRNDLQALLGSLRTLKGALEAVGIRKEDLSPHQHTCLSGLEPVLVGCRAALDDLKYKISENTTLNAADEHIHWLDKARLSCQDIGIVSFKSRLRDCKQTLSIALGIRTTRIKS